MTNNLKKIEKQPEAIQTAFLECVVMPNGEVISMGKTLGWFETFKSCLYD